MKKKLVKAMAVIAAISVGFTGCIYAAGQHKEGSMFSALASVIKGLGVGNMQAKDTNGTNGAGGGNAQFQQGGNNGMRGGNVAVTGEAATIELDKENVFSSRDLQQEADLSQATYLTVSDNNTIDITEEGVYVLSGEAKNCTVKVNADSSAKVQLVLKGVSITNENFPAIYVVSADKCFVTTVGENTLNVSGEFVADGDTNTDAVIYSKDDVVLNGTGTLNITSAKGNGVSGKDDLKVTGGTYNVNTMEDAFEANDSIAIYAGDFSVSTQKDGFHSENEDDDTKGYIYIAGGSYTVKASSDAFQATTFAVIDDGDMTIVSEEGIEATYVQINGGNISITASDDGINATTKSQNFGTPTVEFNGGTTTIVMGQGDTDAIDANGNIIVNGGTIDITAQVSSFDYDGKAELNGGTVIINGTQVSEIPQSMMMGGGMGGFGGPMGGGMRGFENAEGSEGAMGEMPEGFPGNFGEMPQNGGQPPFPQGGFQPPQGEFVPEDGGNFPMQPGGRRNHRFNFTESTTETTTESM